MREDVSWGPETQLTQRDLERTRTCHDLPSLYRALAPLRGRRVRRLLDLGCGFGGITALVREHLRVQEAYGLDGDPSVLAEAKSKGIDVTICRAGEDPLPYPTGFFDLVTVFGIFDSLVDYGPLIHEIDRILMAGGAVLMSTPNLGSWHNRVSLLMGYQPRDIELSQDGLFGVTPNYANELPDDHLHIPTQRALVELMEHHGFATIATTGGRPTMNSVPAAVGALDAFLSRRSSLARRIYYLGQKRRPGKAA